MDQRIYATAGPDQRRRTAEPTPERMTVAGPRSPGSLFARQFRGGETQRTYLARRSSRALYLILLIPT